MSKHLIKIDTPQHVAMSVVHEGKDKQYAEAGDTVALDWQPSSGWGLQEAHYTDEDGNIVSIDLTTREFTMPAKSITIGGTAKRFVIQDWTEGIGKNTKGTAFNRPTLGFEDAGFEYYDETLKKKILWNGTNWVNLDGTGLWLTFIAGEGGADLAFFFNRNNAGEDQPNPDITFEKSLDGGLTWEDHTIGVFDPDDGDTSNLDIISLSEGQSVMFRGVNSENFTVGDPENDEGVYTGFYLDGTAAATGDITSLINGQGNADAVQSMQFYSMFSGCTGLVQAPALPATTLADYCYYSMFSGCTGLVQAPALPATTLADYCYYSMFSDCTGLVQAPALPATTLADYCYYSMFSGCTGLVQAPALPATTLASNCYYSMFNGCTGLVQAPALPATTLASNCYNSMFSGCTGLVQAPALPATTLASSCYSSMFSGCTGLVQAPALPATTLASSCYSSMFSGCTDLVQAPALPATTLESNCYNYMFSGCTSITSYDVETLNNSTNVFLNNTACASFTIHADTPPTIANSTITGLPADCAIYVPAASVDAYKAKANWSARSAYIQAIP